MSETLASERATLHAEWQQKTIKDDPIFGTVMTNPNLCAELLRRALPELTIQWVKDADPQHTIQATPTAKGIRIDVYARDDQNRTYTIEMQMVNEHNLPFRMREYQELMDQEILNSGDDYDKLANYPTYVIFFCNFDYYHRGLARYQFEFRDKWHPEIAAGDLRTLVVFNTKAKNYQHAAEIRPFLDMIRGTVDTKDKFISAVDAEVKEIRADKKREARFMKEQIELRRQLRKSEEAGRDKTVLNIIKSLESQGMPKAQVVKTIAIAESLSAEEAQKYYEQLLVTEQ
ncbi:Rpn family recombination-promoting nuclease/putative transposase [Limosilactobacillus ingluviei]|uniref:Rpn family recombination-promoting nuclease/putative transposase n=1 Tax=Limosilactobacillus ingluviei TaxID=148604 RepID=UPI0002FF618D|nr:Rpn family recombination-promoting nuclease/putative transposase [Limosilactobacillus ingluviei]